jgi:hypothetical protein
MNRMDSGIADDGKRQADSGIAEGGRMEYDN